MKTGHALLNIGNVTVERNASQTSGFVTAITIVMTQVMKGHTVKTGCVPKDFGNVAMGCVYQRRTFVMGNKIVQMVQMKGIIAMCARRESLDALMVSSALMIDLCVMSQRYQIVLMLVMKRFLCARRGTVRQVSSIVGGLGVKSGE